jgi:hypothetical protein
MPGGLYACGTDDCLMYTDIKIQSNREILLTDPVYTNTRRFIETQCK